MSLNLKQKQIIRSRASFETLAILLWSEERLIPGDYLFERRLSVFKIAWRVATRNYHLAQIRITIPEGLDLKQIADLLSTKLDNFDREKFLAEASEGYLFPDTYFFFPADNEKDVLNYLTENFRRKIKPLETEISAFVKKESEIITMASLLEREAKKEIDRRYISGILWRRLAENMPLQVDAAMETYKTRGLPQKPICNPGLATIEAALRPITSPNLFYLYDKDGNIHYARTFEEHKVNKFKYLK